MLQTLSGESELIVGYESNDPTSYGLWQPQEMGQEWQRRAPAWTSACWDLPAWGMALWTEGKKEASGGWRAGRNAPLDDSLPQMPCTVKCNIGFLSEASEAIVLVNLNWDIFPQKTSNVKIHYKPLE